MRMRPVPAPKKPKFEKPTDEDMRESLVRLDRIEVWGARAYVFQALPGYAGSVQQGVIGLFRDRRVVYGDVRLRRRSSEDELVGARRRPRSSSAGAEGLSSGEGHAGPARFQSQLHD